jgi:hypothetical protein
MELLGIPLAIFLIIAPIAWTVRRTLRPVDQAAKKGNKPFQFMVGDFLCLFWVIQLPLAAVSQIGSSEAPTYFWEFFGLVWVLAPIVWVTCARALSKAGISGGLHRWIYLALIVPTVYYGLFPFIWLSMLLIADTFFHIPVTIVPLRAAVPWWVAIGVALTAAGFYTPRMINQVTNDRKVFEANPTATTAHEF